MERPHLDRTARQRRQRSGLAINWEGRNEENARLARERALELLILTKRDPKNRGPRLREICRLYEVVVNDLYGFDDIKPDREGLERYFNAFGVAANRQRAERRKENRDVGG